jgi:methylsterol monooxygenase
MAKAKPQYPPGLPIFVETFKCLTRSSVLGALFTVYVVNHAAALPQLLTAARQSPAVQGALAGNPLLVWLQRTFFDGHTAAQLEGRSLFDALAFVACFMLAHEAAFWGLGGALLLCDRAGWLQRYKLPRTARMAVSPALLRRTVAELLLNHFAFQPVALFLVYRYAAAYPAMLDASGAPAAGPSLFEGFAVFFAAQFVNSVLFYGAHRAFHDVPFLYRHVHKKHHMYVGSIGFAAEFAHPLEQLVANQLPTLVVVVVASRHLHQATVFAWIAARVWETVEAHSGYSFAGSWPHALGLTYADHAAHHDWHHSDNRGCYSWEWLDWLCGTMDSRVEFHQRGAAATRKAARVSAVRP